MRRVIWFVLDSLGIGGAPDAKEFGDEGADTLGHIAQHFYEERGRILTLPRLQRLGLGECYRLVHDQLPMGWEPGVVTTAFGAAKEVSTGKDTPSGHWEMAGVPVTWEWASFPDEPDCFPEEKLAEIYERCELEGSLGNGHASGTEVIARLGSESIKSGKPIFYTSADSVFQIAAHEDAFGLGRLYSICQVAREVFRNPDVGRVIARPFVGEDGQYERTGNRKDYAVVPPKATVLERVEKKGHQVFGVGKIADIYAHVGISQEMRASGMEALWGRTREAVAQAGDGDLVMTNFVDFDSKYGHRRDPRGYGLALEAWDRELDKFIPELQQGDLLVVTADHGNDPTWTGTDHTREMVPVMVRGGKRIDAGIRETFADVGATVAKWLGVKIDVGTSLL